MAALWIVDRIAAGVARLEGENRAMRELPLDRLPAGLREGDCLREDAGGFHLDEAETQRRREAASALFQRLKRRTPSEEDT